MNKGNRSKDNTYKKIKNFHLCFTLIKMNRKERLKHDCIKAYCTSYEPKEDEHHICYMKKKEKKDKNKKNGNGPEVFTCYYDIETFQQNKGTNNKGSKITELLTYLLVCQMISNMRTFKEGKNTFSYCGPRTRTFKLVKGEKEPVEKFIEFLMNFSSKHSKSKVVIAAHFGGWFDHQYIFAALLTHPSTNAITSNPVKRGSKFITFGANDNIVFRDTLLFTPFSLKNMPLCMEITDQGVSKGFFPIHF